MSATGKKAMSESELDAYVKANVASWDPLTQQEKDRLYGLLAPVRKRVTELTRARMAAGETPRRQA